MKKFGIGKKIILFGFSILALGCSNTEENNANAEIKKEEKIFAFVADVHFHDVYSEFQDESFKGLLNPKNDRYATIRTMEAQLNSTRLFNENYFAFIAALEDIGRRGITEVVLPGDLTDDGQPMNIRGIKAIMNEYQEKYGLNYYMALGNHDPVRPYTKSGGKHDFLGEGGLRQPIYSHPETYNIRGEGELPAIGTDEQLYLGYEEIMDELSEFGLYPTKEYSYWASPFSTYTYSAYSYELAKSESAFEDRIYEVFHEGSGGEYKKEGYTNAMYVPDSSYVVEVEGDVWLLSIDANVFVPKAEINEDNTDADNYNSPSNAGYNKVVTHKEFLVNWIEEVAKEAESEGKTLIAFSHYPIIEFYNDAAEEIEEVFGQGNFQLARVPAEDTSKVFADAGVKIHFGGHMHFNDTSVRKYSEDNFIVNVQIPSLAAYIPAYKLLTIKDDNMMEVETVVLDEVEGFDELFDLYEMEYEYLASRGHKNMWNKDVLTSKSYYELNEWHIKELTRLRFLPREWPGDVREMVFNLTGMDMLTLSLMETETIIDGKNFNLDKINDEIFQKEFKEAGKKATLLAEENNISVESLEGWSGFELITDFYRLRNADELALRDISLDRIKEYRLIGRSIETSGINLKLNQRELEEGNNIEDIFKVRFDGILGILDKFMDGVPSDHFIIDMNSGDVRAK